VLILLPPSEAKTGRRRGRPVDPGSWSFPELASTRAEVQAALVRTSASGDALVRLNVTENLAADVAANLELDRAPSAPAIDVYSGVLYGALSYATLDAAARRRANRWLVIMSALHGAVRPTDRIAPYRCHICARLDGLDNLERVWRPRLGEVLPGVVGRGLVVDGRSSSYATLWRPHGALADRWVAIKVPGASHLAKQTRGLVARTICEQGLDPRRPEQLADSLSASYGVALDAPDRVGAPWTLSVTAR
jgi:cytoplasmic iron level regulating protein YaaA (DUF328/UPF0246 family)